MKTENKYNLQIRATLTDEQKEEVIKYYNREIEQNGQNKPYYRQYLQHLQELERLKK